MNKIINILKKQKSLPIDEFIDEALYNKKFGYYIKKNPFGKKGDFITSPMISNLFAEMIAIWIVSFWLYLKKPKKILIVELGPGDGSLCKDLLVTFKKFKDFYECLEINLFEISDKLKKIQKRKIDDEKVKWINNLQEIKYGPIIFLGNEFFDSLPIKKIHKKGNLLLEEYVTVSKKNKIKFVYKKTKNNLFKEIKKFNLLSYGSSIEYPNKAVEYLKVICKKVTKFNGGLLIFDYGYLKGQNHDTLKSIKNHKHISLFSKLGCSDITSHLNFHLFGEIIKKNKLEVEKIINQSEFLQKMGIETRANIVAEKMTFKEKANMYYRLKNCYTQKKWDLSSKFFLHIKKTKNFL